MSALGGREIRLAFSLMFSKFGTGPAESGLREHQYKETYRCLACANIPQGIKQELSLLGSPSTKLCPTRCFTDMD
jgi:hypothetical protein